MTTIDSRRQYIDADQQPSSASSTSAAQMHSPAENPPSVSTKRQGIYSWERSEWVAYALCREDGGDSLFVKGAAQRAAALCCRDCPVLIQCRADALDSRVEFGVWGGMTERERRSILRHFPDVPSWRDLLDPLSRNTIIAEGEGDPEGALEALKTLNVNTERRFKRHKSSQIQQFTRVLTDIANRLDAASEDDDDSEIETLEAIETLRNFGGRAEPD